jgi:hypothetical protein
MIDVPHIMVVRSDKSRIITQIVPHQREHVDAIAGKPGGMVILRIKPPETVSQSHGTTKTKVLSGRVYPPILFLIEIRHATWGIVLK